jgi:hypothetical protein
VAYTVDSAHLGVQGAEKEEEEEDSEEDSEVLH